MNSFCFFKYRKFIYLFVLFFLLITSSIIISEYYVKYEHNHKTQFNDYCNIDEDKKYFTDVYHDDYIKDIQVEKRISEVFNQLIVCLIIIMSAIGILLVCLFLDICKNFIKLNILSYYNLKRLVKYLSIMIIIILLLFNFMSLLFELPLFKLSGLKIVNFIKEYKYFIFISDILFGFISLLIIFMFKLCFKNNNV